ncbi:MAG: hypothetical protein QGG64_22030 [Candidatus Latescibacteria bacterium]|jgi:hypothetical protein|nr:hypothetical protein [Candidatus Latescibacterota bacterium]
MYIPSEEAPNAGVAVKVSLPEHERYSDGSPVIIHVGGGLGSDGLNVAGGNMTQHGFVEVRFAFAGGGSPGFKSGGTWDFRGRSSIRMMADVTRFAMGQVPNKEGKYLRDISGNIRILNRVVGYAGWSHGGNASVISMAEHGDEFPEFAFVAMHESPLGDGIVSAELGGFGGEPNPAYNPDTGVLDLSLLAYDPAATTVRPRGGRQAGQLKPEIAALKGALYYDCNRNGQLDEEGDFRLNPVLVELPDKAPFVPFSLQVLEEVARRNLIIGKWPEHILTLNNVREFWFRRDGSWRISEAVRNCPNVKIIVYGNEIDHVQRTADHVHLLTAVEGFLNAGARFVRLNPDRSYVEHIMGTPVDHLADNPAGKHYDHLSIRSALEPAAERGRRLDRVYMAAAMCELADRTYAGNMEPNLDGVIDTQR